MIIKEKQQCEPTNLSALHGFYSIGPTCSKSTCFKSCSFLTFHKSLSFSQMLFPETADPLKDNGAELYLANIRIMDSYTITSKYR